MSNHPLNTTPVQPPSEDVIPRHTDHQPGAPKAERPAVRGLGTKFLYERYGILENPFGVTPNPRYLYQSRTHAEARSSLVIGIECGVGFQALIAPPGMGKTTILFNLLERFNKVARTAFLFQIHGGPRDFLRHLISELGGEAHDLDVVRMQDTINQLLIRERRAGRQTIIIIDEAQSLDTSVLETVRMLSNFETPTEKLLQIILAGQPQLAEKLANSEVAQLQQRISILTTLIPFGLEDTRNYIDHRLEIAGYHGPPLFTPAALGLIWERSGGVPREINKLCFNALLLARAVEQKQVDSDILHEVVADLDLDRIRFSTDTSASGTRNIHIDETLRSRNAEADPPTPTIDNTSAAVPRTYQQFYKLSRNPFELTIDPLLLCPTPNHNKALAFLYAGVLLHKGLIVLTGEVGTGKTMVVSWLIELLRHSHIAFGYVFNPRLSPLNLLKYVAAGLALTATDKTKDELLIDLQNYLTKQHEQKLTTVLVVDDAHHLSKDALEEVRLLTNLETAQQKLLQIILVGQPRLDQTLDSFELRQLEQRIAARCYLEPLDEEGTKKYIKCRLQVADANSHSGALFCDDAVTAIYRHSRGIPRLINALCENALIEGYGRELISITSDIIEEIAHHLRTDVVVEKETSQMDRVDTKEILEAARTMAEFRARLQSMRSKPGKRTVPQG